jgi:hypothetical protein
LMYLSIVNIMLNVKRPKNMPKTIYAYINPLTRLYNSLFYVYSSFRQNTLSSSMLQIRTSLMYTITIERQMMNV